MRIYNILELNEKLTIELRTIAKELGIRRPDAYKKDELIYKEYIYSLLNQSKITETEKFIVNNISNFKIPTYKAEAISNLILHSSHKKRNDIAKKWLIEFKKEFNTERYKKQIELLESTIQKNDTTSS